MCVYSCVNIKCVCVSTSILNKISYTVITSGQGSETQKALNIDHHLGFPLESKITNECVWMCVVACVYCVRGMEMAKVNYQRKHSANLCLWVKQKVGCSRFAFRSCSVGASFALLHTQIKAQTYICIQNIHYCTKLPCYTHAYHCFIKEQLSPFLLHPVILQRTMQKQQVVQTKLCPCPLMPSAHIVAIKSLCWWYTGHLLSWLL